MRRRRFGCGIALAAAALWLLPAQARAEWQLRPFLGPAFAGQTTFVDFDQAAGNVHATYGVGMNWLGDMFGVDGDLGYSGGFFDSGSSDLVLHSGVMTLTGNAVVALPRHMTQYSLRPYVVGGVGLMRVRIDHAFDVLPVTSEMLATDFGGGATGFLTRRIGLNWEVRRFASRSKAAPTAGVSIGPEDLSFWRASMALAIRLGHGA